MKSKVSSYLFLLEDIIYHFIIEEGVILWAMVIHVYAFYINLIKIRLDISVTMVTLRSSWIVEEWREKEISSLILIRLLSYVYMKHRFAHVY